MLLCVSFQSLYYLASFTAASTAVFIASLVNVAPVTESTSVDYIFIIKFTTGASA